MVPGSVVLAGLVDAVLLLQVGRFDPDELQLPSAVHGSLKTAVSMRGNLDMFEKTYVFQRLAHTHVGVMQTGVLSYQGNRDGLEHVILAEGEALPFLPDDLAVFLEFLLLGNGIDLKKLADSVEESLLLQKNGDLVGSRHVVDSDDLIPLDLARVGDLLNGSLFQGRFATAGDQVRSQTSTSYVADGSLGGFRLLLRADQRNVADLDLQEVVLSGASLKLGHGLDEGRTLDITDGSTQLGEN